MNELKINQQVIPTNWNKREILRNKGQFWTPDWVTMPMVEYVTKDSDLIFDPATETGAFLQAMLLLNKTCKYYGTDIDENVLKSIIYNNPVATVEKKDFIKNPPNRKFDAIIANPPYIRHHRIDEQTKELLRQLTTKIIGSTIDGRAGYHIYFLLQALNLLNENGRLAFIMPADTCEGVFSKKLWNWIGKNYLLESVITFSENAAPFPEIDTNAIIFLIKNQKPINKLLWIKVNEVGNELLQFIQSDFTNTDLPTIDIIERELSEALQTGLSRPPHQELISPYKLSDFATVMRGIATGANDFFFLTNQQIEELNLPKEYFRLTLGRTRDVENDILTTKEIIELDRKGRPTMLLYIDKPKNNLPKQLMDYIKEGEKLELNKRALIKSRNPWYKTEKREIPEMLFAYLGRRDVRFIKNEVGVLPLHCLHCVYTNSKDKQEINNLWTVLNHPETLENLKYVSKSYGSGALKAEPQSLKDLPVPEKFVKKYNLTIRKKLIYNTLF